jgi:hypothetical protein
VKTKSGLETRKRHDYATNSQLAVFGVNEMSKTELKTHYYNRTLKPKCHIFSLQHFFISFNIVQITGQFGMNS